MANPISYLARAALLLTLLASVTSSRADDPTPPDAAHFKVFLLIGQSNMAGRGKPEPQDKQPHPRVLMLDKEGKWVPAVAPLHFDKPNVAGVGPGDGFGRAVADALPTETLGLVPCAVGGTSITQWNKDGDLYAAAVRRAKLAQQRGTLAGILWHQGEADSAADKVAAYPDRAAQLFAVLRADLAAPDVPIVVGTLGDFLGDRAAAFNTMLATLPQKIPHCAVAESKGLTDKGDHLHFDAPSARELGKRYAAAWLKLTAKP